MLAEQMYGDDTARIPVRMKTNDRIFKMSVAKVYPLYIAKAERKGRTKAEVDAVICWLTGYSRRELDGQLKAERNSWRLFWQLKIRILARSPNMDVCTKIKQNAFPFLESHQKCAHIIYCIDLVRFMDAAKPSKFISTSHYFSQYERFLRRRKTSFSESRWHGICYHPRLSSGRTFCWRSVLRISHMVGSQPIQFNHASQQCATC